MSTKFPNIELGAASNAESDYKKTVVVDISGKNSALAASIASDLGGEVGKIPAGEKAPSDVDILIILGK